MEMTKFNENSSAAKVFDVEKLSTTIKVSTNSPIYVGEDAVISIELGAKINATVKLNIGGKTYDVAVVNGKGSFNVSKLANDTYEVNVTFEGNDKYSAVSDIASLKVNKITDYIINVTVQDIDFNEIEHIVM